MSDLLKKQLGTARDQYIGRNPGKDVSDAMRNLLENNADLTSENFAAELIICLETSNRLAFDAEFLLENWQTIKLYFSDKDLSLLLDAIKRMYKTKQGGYCQELLINLCIEIASSIGDAKERADRLSSIFQLVESFNTEGVRGRLIEACIKAGVRL